MREETLALHAGFDADPATLAVLRGQTRIAL
jgi:hypothetical protein